MHRLLALLVLVIAASAAQAETRIRPAAVVEGPMITLGDLIEDAGQVANVAVAPAPPPGERRVFKASHIAALASAKGLKQRVGYELPRIVVTRASRMVPRERVRKELHRAIRKAGVHGRFEIELRNHGLEFHVATDQPRNVEVRDLGLDRGSGHFTATLAAPANDPTARSVNVSGRVHPLLEIPVLNRFIAIGRVIEDADIDWIAMRSKKVRRNTAIDIDQIVGLTPRRPVQPGRPIRTSDLRNQVMVAKGAIVTMSLSGPGLTLTATGRAIESGAQGDIIRVANLKSNRIVQAKILSPGRVVVAHDPQFAAAAN